MASASLSPTFGSMEGGHDQRSSLIAALRARLGESGGTDVTGDVTEEAPDFESDGLALVPPKEEEAMEDVSMEYLSDFLFAHAQDAPSSEMPEGEDAASAGIENKFMQMDKRSDARSKVMDALKVQMSRSAAIPKQAPPTLPAMGRAGGSQVIDLELDSPDEMPAPAALTYNEPPQVCPCGNVPKRTAKFCIQCGRAWEAAAAAPPQKRRRQHPAGLAPPLAPAPPLMPMPVLEPVSPAFPPALPLTSPTLALVPPLAPMPPLMPVPVLTPAPPFLVTAPPLTSPVPAPVPKPAPPLLPVPPLQPHLVPLPAPVPQLQLAPPAVPTEPFGPQPGSAEAAELAARKAAMLGRLQAAETVGQAAAVASNMPPLSAPGKAGPPNQGSGGPSPDVSGCPPGSTPEQYEAYRRKCWEQYYEYTSVWKKYYDQNQAEQTGKGKTKDKGKGKMKGMQPGSIPADLAQNPAMALSLPGKSMAGGKGLGARPAHVVPPPGYAGKGAPLLAMGRPGGPPTVISGNLAVAAANQLVNAKVPQAMPPEEDIHSKLLGL